MTPALLAALLLATAPVAHAPPWRPSSASAVNVTGNVILSPGHFVAAGADFPLRLAAEIPNLQSHRVMRQAMIFEVTTPMNPVLLGAARLCGPRPPAWIVAVPIAPNGLEIAVFLGPKQPTGPDSPGVCATYFYNR